MAAGADLLLCVHRAPGTLEGFVFCVYIVRQMCWSFSFCVCTSCGFVLSVSVAESMQKQMCLGRLF